MFTIDTFITLLVTFLLLVYVLATIDDLFLDLAYLFSRRRIQAQHLKASELLRDHPARIAVMVGAWQEAGVVTPMVFSTLEMMQYPASQVDFFLGVYPNDAVTLAEVQELASQTPNVHCVINEKPGPTSKSQNLNGVYAYIEQHEQEHGQYDIIAVHDAEDVIHPYTFNLYSALLKRHQMVQLPVFALFPKVTRHWRSWLANVVSGSYADEFAEHHLRHMPAREAMGLFIPSAGTGFAMRRQVMRDLHEDGNFLTEGALTEDYELALRLWRKGIKVHFHAQPLPRINQRGRVVDEFIAVKENFPTEVPAAIKQKGRWTYGITLQTPQLTKDLQVNLIERITLWHDQKGKFTNLVHLLGYPFALLLLLGAPLGLHFHHTALTWALVWAVVGLTVWRVLMRGSAVYRLYGLPQALISTLLLPGLPLRWLIGNYVNTLATVRAWRLYLFPEKGQKRGTARWDKTERKSYVPDEVLAATRRGLSDHLLLLGALKPSRLAAAVMAGQWGGRSTPLDEVLMDDIADDHLQEALARLRGIPFLKLSPEMLDTSWLEREQTQSMSAAILGERQGKLLVATPLFNEPTLLSSLQAQIKQLTGRDSLIYATSRSYLDAAYQRLAISGSRLRTLLSDQTLPLDMLKFELDQLQAERQTLLGLEVGSGQRPAKTTLGGETKGRRGKPPRPERSRAM